MLKSFGVFVVFGKKGWCIGLIQKCLVCVKVYEVNKGEVWKVGWDWCKYIKMEVVLEVFVCFVFFNFFVEKEYDGVFCKVVYGVIFIEF